VRPCCVLLAVERDMCYRAASEFSVMRKKGYENVEGMNENS